MGDPIMSMILNAIDAARDSGQQKFNLVMSQDLFMDLQHVIWPDHVKVIVNPTLTPRQFYVVSS